MTEKKNGPKKYVYPELARAQARAAKYGVQVHSSNRGNKKLYVIVTGRDGKPTRVDFGDRRHGDYLIYSREDPEKAARARASYRARASNTNDRTRAGFWARVILW